MLQTAPAATRHHGRDCPFKHDGSKQRQTDDVPDV
jgi:hypothetical protein